MRFFSALWAITRNTVQEIFRQPVYGMLILIGMVLIAFSPAVTMFTMMEDVKLLIDMGLATTFILGMVLAVFAASSVISHEIDSKTVATVMSKPVGRLTFLLGKFLGLLIALFAAEYLLTLILVMTVRFGVPETASFEWDWPVFWAWVLPLAGAIGVGVYRNYFHRAVFISNAIWTAIPFYTLAFLALCVIGPKWRLEWFARAFAKVNADAVAKAGLLVFLGVTILVGLALAASTRVNVVANVIICAAVFFLGMVSFYLFGQWAGGNPAARTAYAILPNLQTFWISESFVEKNPVVPWQYIRMAATYALCYNAAMLALAAFFFEDRELV